MKIKMLTLASGPDGHLHIGKIYDLAKEKAEALIKAGAAVAYKIETTAGTGAKETAEGESAKGGKKGGEKGDEK